MTDKSMRSSWSHLPVSDQVAARATQAVVACVGVSRRPAVNKMDLKKGRGEIIMVWISVLYYSNIRGCRHISQWNAR
jgi:hypothetical protein